MRYGAGRDEGGREGREASKLKAVARGDRSNSWSATFERGANGGSMLLFLSTISAGQRSEMRGEGRRREARGGEGARGLCQWTVYGGRGAGGWMCVESGWEARGNNAHTSGSLACVAQRAPSPPATRTPASREACLASPDA